MCLFLGWWFFTRNIHSLDKKAVQERAQSLFGNVQLRGTEVYSSFSDTGCDSNTVGLRTSTSCAFAGYKYFKNNGSLSDDLASVDTQITNEGWRRTFSPQNQSELDYMLSDKSSTAITYKGFSGSGVGVSLGYYVNDQIKSDPKIRDLISEGLILAPGDGEYIYGVHIGAGYWNCTNESFFDFCPAPPSD